MGYGRNADALDVHPFTRANSHGQRLVVDGHLRYRRENGWTVVEGEREASGFAGDRCPVRCGCQRTHVETSRDGRGILERLAR